MLAALAAYVAAGIATRSRWLRAWAALAWGAAPMLTAAVTQGRVGPVAVTIVLPLVAAALARALSPDRPGRLTATFAAALGIAVVGSAVPLLGAVGVAVGLAWACCWRAAPGCAPCWSPCCRWRCWGPG